MLSLLLAFVLMIKQRCVGKRRAVDGQRCGAGDNGRNLIIVGCSWIIMENDIFGATVFCLFHFFWLLLLAFYFCFSLYKFSPCKGVSLYIYIYIYKGLLIN